MFRVPDQVVLRIKKYHLSVPWLSLKSNKQYVPVDLNEEIKDLTMYQAVCSAFRGSKLVPKELSISPWDSTNPTEINTIQMERKRWEGRLLMGQVRKRGGSPNTGLCIRRTVTGWQRALCYKEQVEKIDTKHLMTPNRLVRKRTIFSLKNSYFTSSFLSVV